MLEAGQTGEAAVAGSAVDPGEPSAAEALARLRSRVPGADPLSLLPDVHPGRLPRHVALIMDGNGRWARARGFPREFGHRSGAGSVRAVVTTCATLGIEAVTLYSFSSENWKRPGEEVRALMSLCVEYCRGEREELREQNIRFRAIGRRDGLPEDVREALDVVESATRDCTGTVLCLAINYGSRAEIAAAARRIAEEVAAGTLSPAEVDEAAVASRLDTAGLPDPDLLVRTAGEMRLSNYLLWQLSYAELYVTETLWPDFGEASLLEAIRAFAGRRRRFGGLEPEGAGEGPGC